MKKIPLMNLKDSQIEIYDEIMGKLKELISNTQFVGGKEIELFEDEYANYCHTKYAVGCSNGTDAIEIALNAMGIGYGDSVIVPVNSFIATAEAVKNVGANVVFIDVDEFFHISINKLTEYLESPIGKTIKAIIPVHLYGHMADMPKIMNSAKKYNLHVIEDSAQAHGAELNGKRPGEYGDIATFSFYPGKNLGAFGDAGAIATNNKNLYEKCKMLINHGRRSGAKYEHEISGYNKRMDSIQAGILRIKLKHLEKWTSLRRQKVDYYLELLKRSNNIILPKTRKDSSPVWHLFVIKVNKRDFLKEVLAEKGISTGIHYPLALHQQPAFKDLEYKHGDFAIAEKDATEILSLPLWPEISNEDIAFITNEIIKNET